MSANNNYRRSSMSIRLHDFEGEVEESLKWWKDYPLGKFGHLAKADQAYGGFVSQAFDRSHRLARSASASNVRKIREFQFDQPIGDRIFRSSSVSQLSPSHALPYEQRVATRYIDKYQAYKPDHANWHQRHYAPAKFHQTMYDTHRPWRVIDNTAMSRASAVNHYTLKTQRIFFEPRMQPSYLQGSQMYLDNYVNRRLKMIDNVLPWMYSSYDTGRPENYRFNRHLMSGSSVFVSVPTGIPRYYSQARHPRKIYRLTDKFYYD